MASARTRMVRGARPGCFAAVMATGIVSVALRLPGNALLSAALLAFAVATFAVLVVLSGWRVAAFPADLRADVNCPGRAFSYFAIIAACDVLAARLADDGYRGATAALAAAALAGWLGLTCLIPGHLVARARDARGARAAR